MRDDVSDTDVPMCHVAVDVQSVQLISPAAGLFSPRTYCEYPEFSDCFRVKTYKGQTENFTKRINYLLRRNDSRCFSCCCVIPVAVTIIMNLGSKGKKRVVLPSRPEPPTVEQILEDISNSASDDPLFSLLEKTDQGSGPPSADSEVEQKFEQCRRFMELNQRLTETRDRLKEQREDLRETSERLQQDMQEVKTRTL